MERILSLICYSSLCVVMALIIIVWMYVWMALIFGDDAPVVMVMVMIYVAKGAIA